METLKEAIFRFYRISRLKRSQDDEITYFVSSFVLNSRVTSCLLLDREHEFVNVERAIEMLENKGLEFWCENSQLALLPREIDFKEPIDLLKKAVAAPSITNFRVMIK